MTTRVEISKLARIVVGIDAARFLALGVLLFFTPSLFDIPSYDVTQSIAPFRWWGGLMIVTGSYALYAFIMQGPRRVHRSFVFSSMTGVLWSSVFLAALLTGTPDGARLLVPNLALLAIDLVFVSISVQKKGPVKRRGD